MFQGVGDIDQQQSQVEVHSTSLGLHCVQVLVSIWAQVY